MCPPPYLHVDDKSFMSREDFSGVDDYARYVRDNISTGMMVRCCEGYEEVRLGDIGRVMKVSVTCECGQTAGEMCLLIILSFYFVINILHSVVGNR